MKYIISKEFDEKMEKWHEKNPGRTDVFECCVANWDEFYAFEIGSIECFVIAKAIGYLSQGITVEDTMECFAIVLNEFENFDFDNDFNDFIEKFKIQINNREICACCGTKHISENNEDAAEQELCDDCFDELNFDQRKEDLNHNGWKVGE